MKTRCKFSILLGCSYIVALAGAGVPYLIDDQNDIHLVLKLVLSFFIVWAVLLVVTLKQFRVRALWMFLGIPHVLWWPIQFVMIGLACGHDVKACP
jgi:hypothetical protein